MKMVPDDRSAVRRPLTDEEANFTPETEAHPTPSRSGWHWQRIAVAAPLCVVYAALHEFWYDPHHENPVTRDSDLEDFIFLVAGVAAAAAIYAV